MNSITVVTGIIRYCNQRCPVSPGTIDRNNTTQHIFLPFRSEQAGTDEFVDVRLICLFNSVDDGPVSQCNPSPVSCNPFIGGYCLNFHWNDEIDFISLLPCTSYYSIPVYNFRFNRCSVHSKGFQTLYNRGSLVK